MKTISFPPLLYWVLPFAFVFLLSCEQKKAPAGGQYCNQANAILDQHENGPPFTSRDWGNLAVATSRLVYVTVDCGDRITGNRVELCADMREAYDVYVASQRVPRGPKRDAEIKKSQGIYAQMECEPPLD